MFDESRPATRKSRSILTCLFLASLLVNRFFRTSGFFSSSLQTVALSFREKISFSRLFHCPTFHYLFSRNRSLGFRTKA